MSWALMSCTSCRSVVFICLSGCLFYMCCVITLLSAAIFRVSYVSAVRAECLRSVLHLRTCTCSCPGLLLLHRCRSYTHVGCCVCVSDVPLRVVPRVRGDSLIILAVHVR
jgi:hypothetical protein